MELIFETLKRYCSWYFKSDEEITRYINDKILNQESGWYIHSKKKSRDPQTDFKVYGHILREDSIAGIFALARRKSWGSEVVMVGQETIDAAPTNTWLKDVASSAKELHPRLHHSMKDFSFYCVIGSMVTNYKNKDKPKKIRLSKEEKSDIREAKARVKSELKTLGGGSLDLGLEFNDLCDIGLIPRD
ncbi:hypothetical protein GW765_03700 [Candidatus Parcubacteria bacterium]|nr:hypothetical protein [Candidatus Parcubacteria bacterium]